MNRIDLTNLGGFPLEQDTLDFMQLSYKGPLGAVARLCGDKTILHGVVNNAGNVSSGWIAVNGELIIFQGGTYGPQVAISETPISVTFEDNSIKESYFTKTATCGVVGDFPFSDLVPLISLQNLWLPGDLKQKMVDNAYVAANFDVDGYGLNAERGWRLLNAVNADAKGRALVNINPDDAELDEAGKIVGVKAQSISVNELPPHSFFIASAGDVNGDGPNADANNPVASNNELNGNISYRMKRKAGTANVGLTNTIGNGQAHNNMQPSMVVVTLIKL